MRIYPTSDEALKNCYGDEIVVEVTAVLLS